MSEQTTDPPLTLAELRRARDAGEPLVPTAVTLAGVSLIGADLAGLDLSGSDLSGADLTEANLRDTRLLGSCLAGAVLSGACLEGAELMGSDLRGADLTSAQADRAGLGRCDLRGAVLFGLHGVGATFSSSQLQDADLRTAQLRGARFREAQLHGAVLESAHLEDVELVDAEVSQAAFRNVDMRGARLRGLKGYLSADWVGVDVRNVDFSGSWLVRRHMLDENFLAEFRAQSSMHKKIYFLWWLTSDCGRSLYRWSLFTFVIASLYAVAYSFVAIDYGPHASLFSPLYFSIVTFTTLGYGDVLPASGFAQLLVVTEVILGYLGLGGLLSILANKMARRAD